jgi:predicted acyl esterase
LAPFAGDDSMKVVKDLNVRMSDGIHISADIYLPDEDGSYPALVALGAYGKELQSITGWLPKQSRTAALWDGCIETGDSAALTASGFAHVVADSRGSGYSEGIYRFHEGDMEDIRDLVEWASRQTWCNGKVGTIGISQYGVNSVLAACMAPKSLKAAFIQEFITDPYRHGMYHGGILSLFFYGLYYGIGGDSGFALTAESRSHSIRVPDKDRLELKELARNNSDIRHYPNLYHLCHYPEKNPLFSTILLHPYDDSFYQSWAPKTRLAGIKCPVYLVGCWGNSQYTFGTLDAWENITQVPKKLMMTPSGFLERPFHEYHDEIIRWYDYHLKLIENGIMEEPRVKLFVTGLNRWRFQNDWPPEGTTWRKLFLRTQGRLLEEPESLHDVPPAGFFQPPIAVTSTVNSLKYRTPRMPADTDVIGPMALHLLACIDSEDTNWMASVYDIDTAGNRTFLSTGFLRASHRRIDESQSRPYKPYHPHTPESIEAIKPGVIYSYDIELIPIAHCFREGHSFELEIKNAESPKDALYSELFPGGHHLPLSATVSHTIFQNSTYPSYLVIPSSTRS